MGQLNVFYLRNLNLNTHTSETSFPAGSFWKENDKCPSLSSVGRRQELSASCHLSGAV